MAAAQGLEVFERQAIRRPPIGWIGQCRRCAGTAGGDPQRPLRRDQLETDRTAAGLVKGSERERELQEVAPEAWRVLQQATQPATHPFNNAPW